MKKIDLEKVYQEQVKPGLTKTEAEAMEKALKKTLQDGGLPLSAIHTGYVIGQ